MRSNWRDFRYLFHLFSLTLFLFGFWLILSGHYELFFVSCGLITAIAVTWLNIRKFGRSIEGSPLHVLRVFIFFIPWLLLELLKSNIAVAKIILKKEMPISPSMVPIKVTQRSDLGQAIHANSITLTPGTVTCEAENNVFLVHCLAEEFVEGLHEGEMDRRVTAIDRHFVGLDRNKKDAQ
ncbi:Na+/H+ antiporter subunit E [Magnetococcales bacterium HHB-1]